MSELPQVGQTYTHKAAGGVVVTDVKKRGRGYYVLFESTDPVSRSPEQLNHCRDRLKDWQKATA